VCNGEDITSGKVLKIVDSWIHSKIYATNIIVS